MLPKKERLSREAFNRFFGVGKRMHTSHLLVVYSPFPTLHASVVVSKKVGRTAVLRNKIRRRIYDIVRRYHKESGASGVFIFITKPNIGTTPYNDIKEEVIKVLITKK